MPGRRSFMSALIQARRAAERQRIAQLRAQTREAKEAERAQKTYLRAREQASRAKTQAQKAQEKEQVQLYTESQVAEVAMQNEQLEQEIEQLENLLADTLAVDDFLDLNTLKHDLEIPSFSPGGLVTVPPVPSLQMYLPPELSVIKRLLPGAKEKHAQEVAEAHARYEANIAAYDQYEAVRQASLAEANAKYEHEVAEIRRQAEAQHAELEKFQQDFAAGIPTAIADYFTLVLEASSYPDGFPQQAKMAYVPASKQLVVEYDLPPFEIVPEVDSYKYIRAKDEIVETARPIRQRKALYSSVIAQVALRTLHELFEADRTSYLETIVFNGYVEATDRGTGRPTRTCVITISTNRDTFTHLELSKVEPLACLKTLNAGVSKSPEELAPVRPVLEINMVDPSFIQEIDVLSGLDQRPNLMELTSSEFESLITSLFQAMGLETRLTQVSQDGRVDWVAYDPLLGGKVVIQAKRYKNTVSFKAVRHLYRTVMNQWC
jgi:restriction system protein